MSGQPVGKYSDTRLPKEVAYIRLARALEAVAEDLRDPASRGTVSSKIAALAASVDGALGDELRYQAARAADAQQKASVYRTLIDLAARVKDGTWTPRGASSSPTRSLTLVREDPSSGAMAKSASRPWRYRATEILKRMPNVPLGDPVRIAAMYEARARESLSDAEWNERNGHAPAAEVLRRQAGEDMAKARDVLADALRAGVSNGVA